MFIMLEICEYRPEWLAYSYFRWKDNRWEISFYREKMGLFQFYICLPFIHITNRLNREVVSTGTNSYYIKAITTGKVFW